MATLAIDPGAKFNAFAIVEETQLIATWYCRAGECRDTPFTWDRVVCEGQYVAPSQGYAANDMLKVAYSAGMASEKYRGDTPLYYVAPSQWKGSVPKRIHQERILSRLSVEDRCELQGYPKSSRHNIIDAVGIALWAEALGTELERYRYGGHHER